MTPNWKPIPGTAKAERRARKTKRDAKERDAKKEVRRRDKHCRFPLCGCRKGRPALHVSHQVHKGMGGNPKADRSVPELMVLLCAARHRENRISVDQGTVRWEALTAEGANGPIRWLLAPMTLYVPEDVLLHPMTEFELARETAVQRLADLTPEQRKVLTVLARMNS